MSTETTDQLLQQLEDKIRTLLNPEQENLSTQVYEALQYVQSFIARKKKILGNAGTSSAVFLGARLLIGQVQGAGKEKEKEKELSAVDLSLSISTGVLLKWFIEEGAGKDNALHLHQDTPHSGDYCDTQRLLSLLNPLDKIVAGPIVDTIYSPLHLVLAKTRIKKNSELSKRVLELEVLFASVLLECKRWLSAFKAYARLQDGRQLAKVLTAWAADGFATEKPLFYARGLMQLLADNKVGLAKEVLAVIVANNLIEDNIADVAPTGVGGLNGAGGGPMSASLAVYHVATILTDLANFPPMPRVDKTKLFGLLLQRYATLFSQLDPKLFELFIKVGDVVFEHRSETLDTTPNPMTMLQNLLAGGMMPGASPGARGRGGNAGLPPGLDLKAMLNMMSKFQQS